VIVSPVLADTSQDVTITARGFVIGAPAGFTVYYISDYEVGLSWTKPEGADNTMVRAAYGRTPESRTDGYLVYYGGAENASDTAVSLDETAAVIYYKAWSQTAGGIWEEEGVKSISKQTIITSHFHFHTSLPHSKILSHSWHSSLSPYPASLI